MFSREFNKYLRVPLFVSQFTIGNCKIYYIHLTFKIRGKVCSKIEKTWFLLVHWVDKQFKEGKTPDAVAQWDSVKREFLKIS